MKYGLVTFFIFLLVSLAANAQYFDSGQDPASLRWLQIKTRNFTLVYPESYILEGDTFDGAQQRAQQVIATDDLALDRHVAEHKRKGFRYETKILRPELVAVYRFTPPAQ